MPTLRRRILQLEIFAYIFVINPTLSITLCILVGIIIVICVTIFIWNNHINQPCKECPHCVKREQNFNKRNDVTLEDCDLDKWVITRSWHGKYGWSYHYKRACHTCEHNLKNKFNIKKLRAKSEVNFE
jgi:hypothetical protein